MPHITIYTDGGANPNPGPGGWGALLIDDSGHEKELSGGDEDTTNNRMELTAVIEALNSLDKPHDIDLYVDSQYVKNGLTSWIHGWIKKGWKTSTGSPVKNKDLWQKLHEATQHHNIKWNWVKGHAGDEYNERVDQLATEAQPGAEKVEPSEDKLVVFIRVAVPKNDGPGGWAIRVWDGETSTDYSGKVPKVSSSNALELLTAFQIFKTVPKDAALQIFCPSDYLHKGITQWIEGWKRRNWKTASGSPVKHADSWRSIEH
jgi:ribonuclease HI